MYGLKNVRQRRRDGLSQVAWDELEQLLAVYYRGQGYRVEHCGTGCTAARFDGGIDLKLFRDDEYIVVQCKHWNAKQVPHNDVHQLLGVMLNQNATGAILVTSGEFTAYARESAAKLGKVRLIDGDELRAMIGPLPEPAVEPAVPSIAQNFAAAAGERLLSAVEDRVRSRGGRRGRRLGKSIGTLFVLKVVPPLTLALVAFLLLSSGLNRVIDSLQSKRADLSKPSASSSTPPRDASGQPTKGPPIHRTHARTSVAVRSGTTSPCHELIDWQSGTYIDHCAPKALLREPSDTERRELQRKADEAARILAPTTPEFTL